MTAATAERELEGAQSVNGPDELRPLTERVLARLPDGRELWVAFWALVPWANAGINRRLILGPLGL